MIRAWLFALSWIAGFPVQDSLAKFTQELEKLYATGADPKDLGEAIDRYCEGKPGGVRARLAWNRELIEVRDRIRGEFVVAMKPKLGQAVEIGDKPRQSGKLKDLLGDRLVLEVPGGQFEITYGSLGLSYLLRIARPSGGVSEEECVNRGAAGNLPGALETLLKIKDAPSQARAAGAMTGLVLQSLDAALLERKFDKVAADLTGVWLKQPLVASAADGALREFADRTFPSVLLVHAEEQGKKDKKAARKLLDQANAFAKPADLRSKVLSALWSALASGEWLTIRIDETIQVAQGKMEDNRVVAEDADGPGSQPVFFTSFPVPMGEIVGVKARVAPGTTKSTEIRWITDGRLQVGHAIGVDSNPPSAVHCYFGSTGPAVPKATKRIEKKAEYELLIEVTGAKIRSAVDGQEIFSGPAERKPLDAFWFVVNDGKGELLGLQVRKK